MKFTFYSNMQKVDEMVTFCKKLGDNFLCRLTGINLHYDHNKSKYVAEGVYTPLVAIQRWPRQISIDFLFWGMAAGFSVVGYPFWPFLSLVRHEEYKMSVEE